MIQANSLLNHRRQGLKFWMSFTYRATGIHLTLHIFLHYEMLHFLLIMAIEIIAWCLKQNNVILYTTIP